MADRSLPPHATDRSASPAFSAKRARDSNRNTGSTHHTRAGKPWVGWGTSTGLTGNPRIGKVHGSRQPAPSDFCLAQPQIPAHCTPFSARFRPPTSLPPTRRFTFHSRFLSRPTRLPPPSRTAKAPRERVNAFNNRPTSTHASYQNRVTGSGHRSPETRSSRPDSP